MIAQFLLTLFSPRLPHRLIDIAGGENRQPWFLQLNPQHTLPTLVDEGRSLWDSHAICTYLIDKYGGTNHPLYPADLYTRARIQQRLYFDTSVLFSIGRSIVIKIFHHGATGISDEDKRVTHEAYAMLEALLVAGGKPTPYAIGNEMTVADVALVVSVSQLTTQMPLGKGQYPAIEAWLRRMERLPYYEELNTKLVKEFTGYFYSVIERNKALVK